MENILIKYLNESKDLYRLEKATKGSAGFDLLASINSPLEIKAGESLLVPCGFSLQMPNHFEAQVRPRSGLALKNSVTVLNTPGTIDSDYRGEVGVILINHSKKNFHVERGMRIAQIVFQKLPKINIIESKTLSKTDRDKGGFGSTGLD